FIKVKANKNDFSSALINGVKKMTTNRIDGSMNIAMSGGEAMAALNQSVKATYWLDDSKRVVGTIHGGLEAKEHEVVRPCHR
ncbi:hypothetical protein QOZ73_32960, partial [Pseudomonas aeruginosa]|uniref:hypothetical protein n=1 Tax=Pseudomonas aeruginosa TaxID=287 RepID=UPI0034599070